MGTEITFLFKNLSPKILAKERLKKEENFKERVFEETRTSKYDFLRSLEKNFEK
jgi:hypothetical protein